MCNFGGPFAYPLWSAGDDCDKAGHGPTPLRNCAAAETMSASPSGAPPTDGEGLGHRRAHALYRDAGA